MRTTPLLLLLFAFLFSAHSQIAPPEFTCLVGNGTEYEVSWNPPAVQCGPLQGFVIYYAPDPGGPFQSLTIQNPLATDTTFASAEQVLYCYMESLMNCPGESPVPSDTLIYNQAPPVMQSVSVNSAGLIEVAWQPGTSPDIAAYLVYVDGANFPDTVWGNGSTVYTDLTSDASADFHAYRLAWFRDCSNDGDVRGSIGQPYRSIYLSNLQQNRCERSFQFNWTAYENYSAGINGYEIAVSENGSGYTAFDTVSDNQQIYTYTNALAGTYYCFRINALLPDGRIASSNEVCDTARVVEVPMGAHIRNVSVLNDNSVSITYYPDTSGAVDLFRLQRSITGNNFQEWPSTLVGTAGNPAYEIYRDDNAMTAAREYWYRFYREDECANAYPTDSAKTILLRARLSAGLSAQLTWTPFRIANGTVDTYHVLKIVNGDTSMVASLGPNTLEYEDPGALNSTQLDTVCYLVTADFTQDIPGRVTTVLTSRSNSDCLQPTPQIITPSAFAPEGFNNIFKPIIRFGTANGYVFRIYDRLGRMLFETNDPGIGWNGTDNGQIVSIDNYVFYVSFIGQDGLTYSKAGNVIAVR